MKTIRKRKRKSVRRITMALLRKRQRALAKRKRRVKSGTYSLTLNDYYRIDFRNREVIRSRDGKTAGWYLTRKQPRELRWRGIKVPAYVVGYVWDVLHA